jgi:hypothetical protein
MDVEEVALAFDIHLHALKLDNPRIVLEVGRVVESAERVVCESCEVDLVKHLGNSCLPTLSSAFW